MFTITYAQKDFMQYKKNFVIDRVNGIPVYDLVFFKTKTNISYGGQTISCGKNTVVVYNKFSRQYYYSAEECLVSDFIHFDVGGSEDEEFLNKLIFDKPLHVEHPEIIENILDLIIREHYGSCTNRDISSSELLKILIRKLEEEIINSKIREDYAGVNGVEVARERIFKNLQRKWSVGELAESCLMSKSCFQTAYKKNFGTSVISDLISARLEMAKAYIIDTDYSIKEISLRCGYGNVEHFSRQFKKAYGITPLRFRINRSVVDN